MFWALKDLLKFFSVDSVFTENVELAKCSVNGFLASGVGGAANSNQKFVVVHIAVFACVEVFK
jgi:hypothetical protein